MTRSLRTLAPLLALTALAAGCGVPPVDETLDEADATRTAEACVPLGPTATFEIAGKGTAYYGTSGTFYGCNDRFVVTITNTLGKSFTPFARWADPHPPGEFGCELANIYASVQGVYPSGVRQALGTVSETGTWYPGANPTCSTAVFPAYVIYNSPFSKIIVSAKATLTTFPGGPEIVEQPKPVTAGLGY